MRYQSLEADRVCRSCARPIYSCTTCGKDFYPMKKNAKTCSDKCRVARSYNRKNGLKEFKVEQ